MADNRCFARKRCRRTRFAIPGTLASVLIVALFLPFLPGSIAADGQRSASLGGRVLSPDGKLPADGAVLKAVHIISQRVYTSPPSDPTGRFTLTELPAGYYDVGIEFAGQLFVAGSILNLSDGGKINLDFVLQPYGENSSEWWQGQKREIPVLGQEQGLAKVLERSRATGGGKSFWKKPGGIAIIAVGGGDSLPRPRAEGGAAGAAAAADTRAPANHKKCPRTGACFP